MGLLVQVNYYVQRKRQFHIYIGTKSRLLKKHELVHKVEFNICEQRKKEKSIYMVELRKLIF